MSNKNDLPLCPAVNWTVFTIPEYDSIAIQFDFLTNPLQRDKDANRSPNFVMTAAQAHALALKIFEGFQNLESAGFQTTTLPKH